MPDAPKGNASAAGPKIRIPAIRGKALGFVAFRGFAPLSLLSRISRPDVYDQNLNPTGTQRDLKARHAQEAHDYALREEKAFFPEVVLNVRTWDDDYISWEPAGGKEEDEEKTQFGYLVINADVLASQAEVTVSRVDGNHRLAYAGGSEGDYEAVNRLSSFCILNIEDWNPVELKIFRDVNETPMRMSATHLYQAITRLFSDEEQRKEYPEVWMADQLNQDTESVFKGRVYKGAGSKKGYLIKLNQLASMIREFRITSTKLHVIEDAGLQYKILRDFWAAVQANFKPAFDEPRKHVVLKSPGLYALGRICASFVDEGIAGGHISVTGTLLDGNFFVDRVAVAAQSFNWSSGGDFEGLQGKAGGNLIAKKVITAVYKKKSGKVPSQG